jgi:hypothetical protein
MRLEHLARPLDYDRDGRRSAPPLQSPLACGMTNQTLRARPLN